MARLVIKGVKVRERYYKNPRSARHSQVQYRAWGNDSSPKINEVLIYKDPRLKKHPKLEKAIMHHEEVEIRLRRDGMGVTKAHKIAMSKEPKIIKNKSLKQLWEMLK